MDYWKPNTTVAAIIERDGRFLMVEEHTPEGLRLNQPAGHLDPGETLAQAVAREALEETAHRVEPQALVGVYMSRYQNARDAVDVTYLRFAFACRALQEEAGRALDAGIVRAVWMHADEIRAGASGAPQPAGTALPRGPSVRPALSHRPDPHP
jgi:8-oxo-dGTP pyrophosphatase MutT (NUDIX family)